MTACNRSISSEALSGFTLLEIMVSLVIMSVVLVSLFRMQAASLDLVSSGHFKQTAAFLAARQLRVIEQDLVNPNQFSGGFEGAFSAYGWSCEISDVHLSEAVLFSETRAGELTKIDLKITGPGSSLVYNVVTYRYAGK